MSIARSLLLSFIIFFSGPLLFAQTKALLLSDIHFESFADPGKVPALEEAPASKWAAILAGPPSADQVQRFATLQASCKSRGVDTSYPLFVSSLLAMKAQAAGVRFVTVSGDLISHAFSCKYTQIFPQARPGAYDAFVIKTMEFVIDSLRTALPNAAIYPALGNNDTACGDYQLDARSPFLTGAGKVILQDVPKSQRQEAMRTFSLGGYYTANFPAPLAPTRLIVLNHLFMSQKYSSCSGAPDPAEIDEQMGWARAQLMLARRNHEKVWIMGHIPPGVNVYNTVAKMTNICSGQPPVLFLSSERLETLFQEFDDVIELGLFGHTHMDEIRLVKTGGRGVAIKMVPSISPVDGNNPSFTVANVEAGVLRDYEVFAASNQSGVDTKWQPEYDFSRTYHQADFSGSTVAKMIALFMADPDARTKESQDYIRYFFVGDRSEELSMFWPQYTCALSNLSGKDFRSCMCSR